VLKKHPNDVEAATYEMHPKIANGDKKGWRTLVND